MDDASVGEITRKLEDLDINVSDISLEVRIVAYIIYMMWVKFNLRSKCF